VTRIEFYTGVAQPVAAAHKLSLKVFAANRKLRIVTANAEETEALDRLLWESPESDFVPHVRLDSPLRDDTPIIIDHTPSHEGVADVLISWCDEPMSFFARFERLIEIVGVEEKSALAGRRRWQFYKERGYAMTHTDLAKRA
jgi:DNA polymerase III subunit chi